MAAGVDELGSVVGDFDVEAGAGDSRVAFGVAEYVVAAFAFAVEIELVL